MLIDWFTVIAQILNFLILVWLLKHFIYKPILNAIDVRDKKVASELANAEAKQTEAQREKEDFKRQKEELDQQRATLLSKAKDEAKNESLRLIEEARNETFDLISRQHEALRNEKQNLNQAIRHLAQQEVFAIARKTLMDLAETSLEERTVKVFSRKLYELKDSEKEQMASELSASPRSLLILTAFDLSQEQRDLIKKTIQETLGIEIQVKFETSPDLVSGIELTTNGLKVAWSIADYLTSMEKDINELLEKQPKS
jgi:F-type H+-transporting ATPase subunit b